MISQRALTTKVCIYVSEHSAHLEQIVKVNSRNPGIGKMLNNYLSITKRQPEQIMIKQKYLKQIKRMSLNSVLLVQDRLLH